MPIVVAVALTAPAMNTAIVRRVPMYTLVVRLLSNGVGGAAE
jgi:hypothetical protein